MQNARTNEVDSEEALEEELEGGVDNEARHTGCDLDDDILICDGVSHCRRPPDVFAITAR